MDFDGDGKLDMISGSYDPGDLFVFEGLGDGKFADGEPIVDRDEWPVNVGPASAVFAADWDADGDLDMLIGNISGEVYLVTNSGSREKPLFEEGQHLRADGESIVVPHGDAGPVAADWDGDGQLDLVVGGGDGSVALFRNTGTASEPVLAAAETLVPPARTPNVDDEESRKPERGTRSKVCVVDWNGDERLDLLVGDFAYERNRIQDLDSDPEVAEVAKQQEEVMRRYSEAIRETDYSKLRTERREIREQKKDKDPEVVRARRERLKQLDAELAAIAKELAPIREELNALSAKLPKATTYHGWIWLYERRPAGSETQAAQPLPGRATR